MLIMWHQRACSICATEACLVRAALERNVRSYTDFKRHYDSLTTEQLLRIAATSDLVPDAASAMKNELAARRLEIERENYEIHLGPVAPPPPKHITLWLHVAIALLSGIAAFIASAWDVISGWVTAS
jgi:hypothetical protein